MELATWVSRLSLPPWIIMVLIIFVYFILGCFIDALSMILLTVPIFNPIATTLGYDPIWFGVILVLMVEIASITPPVGMNVYVISGIAIDVPMEAIFKGSLHFLAAAIFVIILLMVFPQIALFLPGMGG
jgi:TRAP-type C4-dicarboxylate transport system permease large subunit